MRFLGKLILNLAGFFHPVRAAREFSLFFASRKNWASARETSLKSTVTWTTTASTTDSSTAGGASCRQTFSPIDRFLPGRCDGRGLSNVGECERGRRQRNSCSIDHGIWGASWLDRLTEIGIKLLCGCLPGRLNWWSFSFGMIFN